MKWHSSIDFYRKKCYDEIPIHKLGGYMNSPINSILLIEHFFQIFQFMSQKELVTITELNKTTGIPASKIYRVLSTLVNLEYAFKNEYDCYGLTLKIMNISNNVLQNYEITQKAYPYLKKLVGITKETVHLAQPHEENIIYIGKVDSPHALRIHSYVGKIAPCYCTSLGKAIFAYLPEEYRLKLLEKVEWVRYTDTTITNIEEFLQELKIVHQQAYAEDKREHVDYMHCYGAPIFDYTGQCIAAISVSTPIHRWSEERATQEIIPALLEISYDISRLFGYIKPVPKSS